MATNLLYNGVLLKNVWIRDFDQSPVRDDSGTDILYQRFFISVEAVANPLLLLAANPALGVLSGGRVLNPSSAAELIASARKFLCEDRGDFSLEMEGRVVLEATKLTDNNNGPKVTNLRITQVSPSTIKIQFSIEVHKVDCVDQPSKVINNRWSCVDDTDDLKRITRTWRGKLRVSSAVHNPQDFRGLCVPVLQKGWKRTRLHFVGEANALELGYEVTDVQMIGEAPPDPALKMTYTHTEAFGQVGSLNTGEMIVRLDGGRDSDKRQMAERAVQIIINKLAISKLSEDQGIYKNLTLTDHAGEDINAVEARATVIRTPKIDSQSSPAGALGAILDRTFGKKLELPDYDPLKGVWLDPYGDKTAFTTAGLFACYLQTPCNDKHGMPQIVAVEGEKEEDRGQEAPEITHSEQPIGGQFDAPSYSDDHVQAIYTYAEVTSEIIVSSNRLQMPIATAQANPEETSKIVTVGAPVSRRVIDVRLERIGEHPKIVRPEDFTAGGIKYSLVCFKAKPRAPEQTGDGRALYVVDAHYVYAMSRPLRGSESIPAPPLPWDSFTTQDTAMPSSAFISPTSEKGFG